MTSDDPDIYCPSSEVCGWCGDSECDGIGCIASLDPNDINDHGEIEQLHATLRAGRILIQANEVLARAENRLMFGAVSAGETT